MPPEGIKLISHSEMLTFEEIFEIAKVAVDLGIDKIRITGGEPLVRKGLTVLIKMLSQINGLNDIGLTTNGTLLPLYSKSLFDAGLKRINISLDTMDSQKYRDITQGGNINDVLRGIDTAISTGFNPIKINCVVRKDSNEKDAVEVKKFVQTKGIDVRFIHLMNLNNGQFSIVEGGSGGDCKVCNRLRLTSDGKIKPCLFNNIEFDIKKLGIENAFKQAVEYKPLNGTINDINNFYNIGG